MSEINGYQTMNGGLKYPFIGANNESIPGPISAHPLDQVLNHGGNYSGVIADNMLSGMAIAMAYAKSQQVASTQPAAAPVKVAKAPLIPVGNIAILAAHP